MNRRQSSFSEASEPKAVFSSARSLLKHAGTWAGADLQQRLEEVHSLRDVTALNRFAWRSEAQSISANSGSDQPPSVGVSLSNDQPHDEGR